MDNVVANNSFVVYHLHFREKWQYKAMQLSRGTMLWSIFAIASSILIAFIKQMRGALCVHRLALVWLAKYIQIRETSDVWQNYNAQVYAIWLTELIARVYLKIIKKLIACTQCCIFGRFLYLCKKVFRYYWKQWDQIQLIHQNHQISLIFIHTK